MIFKLVVLENGVIGKFLELPPSTDGGRYGHGAGMWNGDEEGHTSGNSYGQIQGYGDGYGYDS